MAWLGLDIGGAHLKAADARGFVIARPFAVWKAPGELAGQLRTLLDAAPRHAQVAATMTAELADCFATKADGVRAIVDALVSAANGRTIAIYTTDGEFVSPETATRRPLAAAASNWHALAAFAARYTGARSALLIDIGSTTSDLIPLLDRRPAAAGVTDPDRLQSGELVYTGVERTPVAAVVSQLPWRGGMCPVASELFATTADAYLLLGALPEEHENLDTADGRARTQAAAHARLARMICADATMFTLSDARAAAQAIHEGQLSSLTAAFAQVVGRMPAPPKTVILSGHGEFLARALVERFPWRGRAPRVLSLNEELGPERSRCAPAYALAVLAEERQVTSVLRAPIAGPCLGEPFRE